MSGLTDRNNSKGYAEGTNGIDVNSENNSLFDLKKKNSSL